MVFHIEGALGHKGVPKALKLLRFCVLKLLLNVFRHFKVNLLVVDEAEVTGYIVHETILNNISYREGVNNAVIPDELKTARVMQSHTALLIETRLLCQKDDGDELLDWVGLRLGSGHHLIVELFHDRVLVTILPFPFLWDVKAHKTDLARGRFCYHARPSLLNFYNIEDSNINFELDLLVLLDFESTYHLLPSVLDTGIVNESVFGDFGVLDGAVVSHEKVVISKA